MFHLVVLLAGEAVHHGLHRDGGEIARGDADRGQRRGDHLRHRHVVEAHERKVARDGDARGGEGLESAHRHLVVEAKDRGRERGLGQDLRRGQRAGDAAEISRIQAQANLRAGFHDGAAHALQPLIAAVLVGSRDERDVGVAEFEQVLRREIAAVFVVDVDGGDAVAFPLRIEMDERLEARELSDHRIGQRAEQDEAGEIEGPNGGDPLVQAVLAAGGENLQAMQIALQEIANVFDDLEVEIAEKRGLDDVIDDADRPVGALGLRCRCGRRRSFLGHIDTLGGNGIDQAFLLQLAERPADGKAMDSVASCELVVGRKLRAGRIDAGKDAVFDILDQFEVEVALLFFRGVWGFGHFRGHRDN